ncbi:MAG: ORF6N domain-containing protein [Pseudomonadota bacterium]|nr:ORF6N domain-containing protein [Pseudomonadota bacterium]
MSNELIVIDSERIQNSIFSVRGLQVMIDRDLSELYGVENKRLNEQVKRNINRFPEKFRFQLTKSEKNKLVANCDRFETLKHSTSLPYAFTEQGVSMLSAVLKSETAIKVSIQIMDSFVEMRKFISGNAAIFQRLDNIEQKQLVTETKLDKVFEALEAGDIKPKQGIFFDGQIFDAYVFIADLIKSAKTSIVLIDNYVDETVLTLLSKRATNCTATIYTKTITKKLNLDLKKHNAQYPPITIKTFNSAHDRFLLLDNKEIYHIGASLKDLGKKWFAFSKFDKGVLDVLGRLGE